MQTKTCPVTVKAAGPQDGLEEGVVEAIVATYDVDSVGDQIMPGAFAESLAEWKASGDPIPFLWSHRSDDPNAHIGVVEEAEERPGVGLWVKARIDMDEATPRRIYKLLKGRRVRQYSFAYDETDARPPGEKALSGARKELHKLKVYEVGPTPIGCNQNTSTLDVKSGQAEVAATAAAPTPAPTPGACESGTPAQASKGHLAMRKGHGMTARDLRNALDSAVSSAHGGGGRHIWVRDHTDEWVVFSVYSENDLTGSSEALYQQSYTVTDGAVSLANDPTEVVERVVYAPATGGSSTESSIKTDPSNAEKAMPDAPAAALAPEAKSDEPVRPGAASRRLRTALELLEGDSYTI